MLRKLKEINQFMIFVWILLGVIVLHIIFAMIELKCLTTTYYQIKSTKLPVNFGGLKIALLSDIHCCSFGKNNSRLFAKISSVKPDVIIIAGDLINGMKPDEVEFARKFLIDLKSIGFPVIYTYGNHEERYKVRGKEVFPEFDKISKENTILLNNESVKLPDNIIIAGLDLPEYVYKRGNDYTVNVSQDVSNAIASCIGELDLSNAKYDLKQKVFSDQTFNIVIAHDPEHFELYSRGGADLVLSGHVHGGIMRLPFVGGLVNPKLKFFPKYDKGVFVNNGSKMVLSGGIGWHNLPIRFMNRPEVVVIEIK